MRWISAAMFGVLVSGCFEENWIITDRRPDAGETAFFALVSNFDGSPVRGVENFGLVPGETARFTVSSPLPVMELRNLSVKAWLRDPADTTPCEFPTCAPGVGDPTVELKNRSWPWVYEINFK